MLAGSRCQHAGALCPGPSAGRAARWWAASRAACWPPWPSPNPALRDFRLLPLDLTSVLEDRQDPQRPRGLPSFLALTPGLNVEVQPC